MNRIILPALLIICCFSFSTIINHFTEDKPVPIPPSKQRSGDAKEGYKYLITGAYVKGGLPYDMYTRSVGKNVKNYLQREGLNSKVSHEYTAVKAANGENIVAPNCMQCHAQVFDDQLYMGLGNTFIDFSNPQRLNNQSLTMLENFLKKSSPSRYEASKNFLKVTKTIGPYLTTKVRGVNAAGRLTALLAAHRDPLSLTWNEKPSFEVSADLIPSDVPAWWLLKKKNAMFYNGFGRGDFGRFLMVSNLLTVNDSSESSEVDSHMNDVLSYINSLQPPKFPKYIDTALASEGKALFVTNCSKCHGKYGNGEEYPNLLIPESIIKTDSLLFTSNFQNPEFVKWFNGSWFASGDHPARLEPFRGYIAPPLDGIWITAPYLHNGSVPDLDGVLNSKSRPKYWSRDFEKPKYEYEKIGWEYQSHDQPSGNTIYNTDLPGYGNYGHYFGDKLNDAKRRALIEYLKTL
jgi:mono/diheme cytochrome c family protein